MQRDDIFDCDPPRRRWFYIPLRWRLRLGGLLAVALVGLYFTTRTDALAEPGDPVQSPPTKSSPEASGQSGGTLPTAPTVVKSPDFQETKKVAGVVGDTAGKVGDIAKDKATTVLSGMEAARYAILLPAREEPKLIARIYDLSRDAKRALTVVPERTKARLERLENVAKLIEWQINRGQGPSKQVRQKFAEVELQAVVFKRLIGLTTEGDVLLKLGNSFFQTSAADVLHKMVRGEDPNAGDVVRLIRRSATLVKAFRQCEEAERTFHELLVLAYTEWKEEEVADRFYQRKDATPDGCLRIRLDECSTEIATMYAHARFFFDTYLANSPDKAFTFEFPPLTPEETKKAERILAGWKADNEKSIAESEQPKPKPKPSEADDKKM